MNASRCSSSTRRELITGIMARALRWPSRTTVEDSVTAAADYLRQDLVGEAVLTIGGPVHEWREGHIDGVVSVGPHECMPTKIAESQFFHAARREGLLSLTLALNGDPIDPEVLDNFAFEVRERFRRRQAEHAAAHRSSQGEGSLFSRLFAFTRKDARPNDRGEARIEPLIPAARLVHRNEDVEKLA